MLVEQRIAGIQPIDYKTASENDVIFHQLPKQTRIEYRAIDFSAAALQQVPEISKDLQTRGIVLDRVMSGVFSLDSYFSVVALNLSQELVDAGYLKKWGQKMMQLADNGTGENGNPDVKRLLKELVLSNPKHFGIEIKQD